LVYKIVQILENESLGFDEIVRKVNMESAKVGSLLSVMENKRINKRLKFGILDTCYLLTGHVYFFRVKRADEEFSPA